MNRAIPSIVEPRPRRFSERILCLDSGKIAFPMSVGIYPGRIALTAMLRFPHSLATASVRPTNPAFEAQYAAAPAAPRIPEREPMFTTCPFPCLTMKRTTALVQLKAPLKFVAITSSHVASSVFKRSDE